LTLKIILRRLWRCAIIIDQLDDRGTRCQPKESRKTLKMGSAPFPSCSGYHFKGTQVMSRPEPAMALAATALPGPRER